MILSRSFKALLAIFPFLTVLYMIMGNTILPVIVINQSIVQVFEHSIPHACISICKPIIAIAVNPGIKKPIIKKTPVVFVKFTSWFVKVIVNQIWKSFIVVSQDFYICAQRLRLCEDGDKKHFIVTWHKALLNVEIFRE